MDGLRIKVDHREQNDGVLQSLFARDDVVEIDYPLELSIGDYVTEEAIFEVKHGVGDYAASMQDGRLTSQIKRMMETDKRPYVLLGFNLDDLDYVPRSNVHSASLYGFMASLMADFNVPILPCSDDEHLVDMMVRLSQKEERDKEIVLEPNSEVRKIENQNVKFLCTVDGIGVNTAERINEHFPTPASIIQARPEELAEIEGIGQTTALKILSAFSGENQ